MAQTFTDNFDRADTASTLGANWTELGATTHRILSNQAAPVSTATAMSVYVTSCDTDDNYSQVAVSVVAGTAIRVICRVTDATNWYSLLYNGSQIQLQKDVAGTVTLIGSAYVVTLVNGDVIKVSAVGTAIKGYLNGVERCSATDSGLTTGKKVGIRSGSSGNTSLRWNDWAGGDSLLSIVVSGIASGEAFGTAVVSGVSAYIAPAGIASGEAFGTHLFGGPMTVAPTGIPDPDFANDLVDDGVGQFGTPRFAGPPQSITCTGITSGEGFGTASVNAPPVVVPKPGRMALTTSRPGMALTTSRPGMTLTDTPTGRMTVTAG